MLFTIATQGRVKAIKQLLRCQRCGGQVLRLSDDISCLQCGAPHTKEGKLATYFAQELSPAQQETGNPWYLAVDCHDAVGSQQTV